MVAKEMAIIDPRTWVRYSANEALARRGLVSSPTVA